MVEGRVDISPVKPKKRCYNYRKYSPCKYSPSCFECPLADCAAKLYRVFYLNALPEDISRNFHMRNERRFRLHS